MKTLAPITAVLLLAATCAGAQTTQPATRPSAGDQVRSLLSPAGGPLVIPAVQEPPVIDTMMGKNGIAPATIPSYIVKEGTFIVRRAGRLTHGEGGRAEFTLDPLDANSMEVPLLVLPNRQLAGLEAAVARSARERRFVITGVFTEYKGQNYLLLDRVEGVE